MSENLNGRDRDICKLLGTNATELQRLLGGTRQTISKHIKNNDLFGVGEVIKVASAKIPSETDRSRVVVEVLQKYFPEVISFGRDLDVFRFSQYFVFGMDIHEDIAANPVTAKFITSLLRDPSKFVLFACAPMRPFGRLNSWLDRLKTTSDGELASFILIPCRLTELTPVQILADPWSNDPQLIQIDQSSTFVDRANANRAAQIAGALRQYGEHDAKKCAGSESHEIRIDAAKRLMEEMNSSAYDNVGLPESPVVFFSSHR